MYLASSADLVHRVLLIQTLSNHQSIPPKIYEWIPWMPQWLCAKRSSAHSLAQKALQCIEIIPTWLWRSSYFYPRAQFWSDGTQRTHKWMNMLLDCQHYLAPHWGIEVGFGCGARLSSIFKGIVALDPSSKWGENAACKIFTAGGVPGSGYDLSGAPPRGGGFWGQHSRS